MKIFMWTQIHDTQNYSEIQDGNQIKNEEYCVCVLLSNASSRLVISQPSVVNIRLA